MDKLHARDLFESDELIVTGTRTKLLKPGDNLLMEIISSMGSQRIRLENEDILAIANKAVAVAQNCRNDADWRLQI